jgi:hypothetical protein
MEWIVYPALVIGGLWLLDRIIKENAKVKERESDGPPRQKRHHPGGFDDAV